ncbi:hypothetical protein DPMN_191030 [Dreissena polymorpha]|uniref:Uncharacterized protein n=1 Tax=Dreissena polymorpha TaxID=45954 RepID=A0A9D3Y1E5_DREPO|nr:hypothetical protein DPMN_191030 [Dreissena polymorpha]
MWDGLNAEHVKFQSQSLSSLTQLETLSIEVVYYSPGLWKALHGLNIKSLSLSGLWDVLNVENIESQKQSLSSRTHLDTLRIKVGYGSTGLWNALRGLNIKRLSIDNLYLNLDHEESQSLASITQLETLSIN